MRVLAVNRSSGALGAVLESAAKLDAETTSASVNSVDFIGVACLILS